MFPEVQSHELRIAVFGPDVSAFDAGDEIALVIQIACAASCDLRGETVRIISQDGVILKEIELVTFDGTSNESDEFVLEAPAEPGEHTWAVEFLPSEKVDASHLECRVPFSFVVAPHTISMAVWSVPEPAIAQGDSFTVKVGVRCSAGCALGGAPIHICDDSGAVLASAVLSDRPWTGTSALYWTDVELHAPAAEGLYNWTARFTGGDDSSPHTETSHPFGVRTTRPPEHTVTVEVMQIDNGTATPVPDAVVILHPYRARTDEKGLATLEVPKGQYRLTVSKVGYLDHQTDVVVDGDVSQKAEVLVAPPLLEDLGF